VIGKATVLSCRDCVITTSLKKCMVYTELANILLVRPSSFLRNGLMLAAESEGVCFVGNVE